VSKLILLSFLFAPVLLPLFAARERVSRMALRKTLLYMAIYYALGALAVRYVVTPGIWS
jgi:hypothetical protein